jgi:HK97 family phage prohead protease
MTTEFRQLNEVVNAQVTTENQDAMILEGYAVRWDSLSQPIDGWFKEKFVRGSFMETLKVDDQRALINHDKSLVLGRRSAGTLALSEDEIGLKFIIELPDTNTAKDLYKNIKLRNIDGVSFGFISALVDWDETDPSMAIRTIKQAKLFEISIATFPAYLTSSVDARSLEMYRNECNTANPKNDKYKLDLYKKTLRMKY